MLATYLILNCNGGVGCKYQELYFQVNFSENMEYDKGICIFLLDEMVKKPGTMGYTFFCIYRTNDLLQSKVP